MSPRKNYQVNLYSELDGQQIVNVFHYFQVTTHPTFHFAFQYTDWFVANVVGVIALCQTSFLENQAVYAFDAEDESGDNHLRGISIFGTRGADYLPKFMAWQFKYWRGNKATHNGWKRIAGIAKSDFVGGTSTPFMTSRLQGLAHVFTLTLTDTGAIGRPSIYSKSTASHPVRVMYPVKTVTYTGSTTQNTRKR